MNSKRAEMFFSNSVLQKKMRVAPRPIWTCSCICMFDSAREHYQTQAFINACVWTYSSNLQLLGAAWGSGVYPLLNILLSNISFYLQNITFPFSQPTFGRFNDDDILDVFVSVSLTDCLTSSCWSKVLVLRPSMSRV